MTTLIGTSFPPTPPPNPRPFTDFLLDHNPLYLLSAALMLLGCYLLGSAMEVAAGQVGKLLWLLGVLNFYEFLLIGLAVFLWKTRGLLRDSTLLLLIEGLFLADLTFLNSEVAANDLILGSCINAILFILALSKLYIVVRFLKLERSPRTLVFITLQLGLLCALPILLRSLAHDGVVAPGPFYLLWWAIGLLPLLYDLLANFFRIRPAARDSSIRIAWTVLPWLSLIAHLGFQHWIYSADFYLIELAPVLLGLAVIVPRLPMWFAPRESIPAFRAALGFGALVTCAWSPSALALALPGTAATLSPALLTFAATVLTWAYCWQLAAIPWAIAGLMALGLVRLYGPSWETISRIVAALIDFAGSVARFLTPTSPAGWGLVAVISSFITLSLGALVSLTRPKRPT